MDAPDSILARFEQVKSRWLGEVMDLITAVGRDQSPADSSLPPMADYHFATGGKRLRALIPLMVAEALGVEPARVLGFAAACEILHNATLVHDDLQDGDTTRRGEPTIWVKWGAPRAINLGDAMLYWTIAAASRVQFDDAAKMRLISRIVRDTLQVIDGQEQEFLLQEAEMPSTDGYFRMVTGKTSGLFTLPMAGTAELCGADERVVAGLTSAAGHLGVLFQLQDDVLDLYGDKGRGQRGSDIGEGKISALVAHFLAHGEPSDVAWLEATLAAPREDVTEQDVARAAAVFRDQGTLAWVLDEIDRRVDLVRRTEHFDQDPELLKLVAGLAELFVAPIAAVR